VSREYYELGLPIIEKAGVADKIDFRQGPALPLLDELLQDVRAFIVTNVISLFFILFYKLRIQIYYDSLYWLLIKFTGT